jgi:hypothetical protein
MPHLNNIHIYNRPLMQSHQIRGFAARDALEELIAHQQAENRERIRRDLLFSLMREFAEQTDWPRVLDEGLGIDPTTVLPDAAFMIYFYIVTGRTPFTFARRSVSIVELGTASYTHLAIQALQHSDRDQRRHVLSELSRFFRQLPVPEDAFSTILTSYAEYDWEQLFERGLGAV